MNEPTDRRRFLARSGLTAALALAGLPTAQAQAGDADAPRLLVVLLRGGMDGLAAVPPVGEPALAGLRPTLVPAQPLALEGPFALHPALRTAHALWQAGQLAVVHATGFDYTGRSHFEGQDVMQSGVMAPYTSPSGWVGRAMQAAGLGGGVAISIPMPLILRGDPGAATEYPNWMAPPRPALAADLQRLWQSDPALAPYARHLAADGAPGMAGGRPLNLRAAEFQEARSPASLARLAAERMRESAGPRVGLIDIDSGFDTHAGQGADSGPHAAKLQEFDGILQAFREGMGALWAQSLVVTVTEFGRTVAENGTTGTDHGVGSCCFVAGGLVRRSAVIADWRGLARDALFQGRDLPVTIDACAVYARVLQCAFGLDEARIQAEVLRHRPHPLLRDFLA